MKYDKLSIDKKYCSKCKLLLDINLFPKDRYQRSGYACDCKSCRKDYRTKNKEKLNKARIEYVLKNRKKYAEYSKKWRNKNPEKAKEVFKKWADKNPEKIKSINRQYAKKYAWKMTAKVSKRRGLKLSATPKWLSFEQLNEIDLIYKKSKELTTSTGIKHNVDHIIPLKGKNICGLHVPWNLRIITEKENLKKSNKLILGLE
jgi:hypothetical protein